MKHVSIKRGVLFVAALGVLGGGLVAISSPKVDTASSSHMSATGYGGHHSVFHAPGTRLHIR